MFEIQDLQHVCNRCGTTNPLANPRGGHCVNCQQPFVFSFVHFDTLPLVEFTPEADIPDEEAIRLIEFDAPKVHAKGAKRGKQQQQQQPDKKGATTSTSTSAAPKPAGKTNAQSATASVDDMIAQYSMLFQNIHLKGNILKKQFSIENLIHLNSSGKQCLLVIVTNFIDLHKLF